MRARLRGLSRGQRGQAEGPALSPQKRIARAIERRGQIEDAAAKQQRLLLQTLRREILADLAEATGYQQWHLSQLLTVVNQQVAAGKAAAEAAISTHLRDAWRAGIQMADAVIDTNALTGLSDSLLNAVIDVTQDQTRAVWSELGGKLKTAVRRASLGVDDPFKAMQTLASVITDPKTFASPEARAETIIRTEVNRTFAVSQHKELANARENLARVGLEVRKYWLSAEDDRVRESHAEAARRYSKADAIPSDQAFKVGGEELMFPLDPAGSAANTIHCRCVAPAVVIDLATGKAA